VGGLNSPSVIQDALLISRKDFGRMPLVSQGKIFRTREFVQMYSFGIFLRGP
jgi:hypothetical protein